MALGPVILAEKMKDWGWGKGVCWFLFGGRWRGCREPWPRLEDWLPRVWEGVKAWDMLAGDRSRRTLH